jgi:putative ABC transport system permease protein
MNVTNGPAASQPATLWQELRYTFRSLRRSPVFTLTVLLTLALGIGFNLTVFRIARVALFDAPRVKNPDSLVRFERMSSSHGLSRSWSVPYAAAKLIRSRRTGLESVILQAVNDDSAFGRTGEQPLKLTYVSTNWFSELGGKAALGRLLTEDDNQAGAMPAVVVSNVFWRIRLQSDPLIVGRTVWINKRPSVIAGVAEENLPNLGSVETEIWAPIEQYDYFTPGASFQSSGAVEMYGRLRPGVSPIAVKDELRQVMMEFASSQPAAYRTGEWLEPYLGSVGFRSPEERDKVRIMIARSGALTVIIFLVSLTNLSSLVLARAGGRIREFGLRAALGATQWRIVIHLFLESALLAGIGCLLGMVLSDWGTRFLCRGLKLPLPLSSAIDWQTLLAGSAAGALTIAIIGLLPAWRIRWANLASVIRDNGEATATGRQHGIINRALVGMQVAASCLLIILCLLLARGVVGMVKFGGFDFARVAVLEAPLTPNGLKGIAAYAYWRRIKELLRAHPATDRVVLASLAPFGSKDAESTYRAAPGLRITSLRVEPEFFSVMNIPILRGREFQIGDDPQGAFIISEHLALVMYGTREVIGQPFPQGYHGTSIIGVAGDAPLVKYRASDVAEIYRPADPKTIENMILLVRARTDPDLLLSPLRYAAQSADSRVIPKLRLLRSDFDEKLRLPRLLSSVAAILTLLTLALTCIGVYAAVSRSVSTRSREAGIRLALGAHRGSVIRLLISRAMFFAAIGMLAGFCAGAPVSKMLASQLPYLRPADPFVYLVTIFILALTSGLAALVPALRFLRRPPAEFLHYN